MYYYDCSSNIETPTQHNKIQEKVIKENAENFEEVRYITITNHCRLRERSRQNSHTFHDKITYNFVSNAPIFIT